MTLSPTNIECLQKAERLQSALARKGYVRPDLVCADLETNSVIVDFRTMSLRRIPIHAIDDLSQRIEGLSDCPRWDELHDAFDAVLLPRTGRHRGLGPDGRAQPIDIEIYRNKSAIVRYRRLLDESYEDNGPPSDYSAYQTWLIEKMERASKWLCILLGKRNDVGDEQLAYSISIDAWP